MYAVYRIEHPDSGCGPYNHIGDDYFEDFKCELREAHTGDPDRPHPVDDLGIWATHKYFYGCNSLEALYVWFADFWTELQNHGFKIVTYFVPYDMVEVSYHTGQVAFKRDFAIKAHTLKWDQ